MAHLTYNMMVRLTPRDHKRLKRKSEEIGIKPTTFARIVLLNYLATLDKGMSTVEIPNKEAQ